MFDKYIYEGLHFIMKYAGQLNAWAWREHVKILKKEQQIRHDKMIRDRENFEAHTCFNCIDLPDYMDYELLKKSFDTAIDGYAQTFDLL